jgi:hypothetical protein
MMKTQRALVFVLRLLAYAFVIGVTVYLVRNGPALP